MSEELSREKQGDVKKAASTDLEIPAGNAESEKSLLPDEANRNVSDGIDAKDEIETSEKIERVVSRVIAEKFSGPIPPPSIIAGYEDVVPGAADRIIRMAEQQSSHRQQLEMMEMKAAVRDSLLGVIFAFGLGIGCLAACVITVIMVPAAAGAICGSILGVTGIGAIVTAFLKNTRQSRK